MNWMRKAQQLCERLPRECLEPQTLHWLQNTGAEEPWCIGCSGGVDSVALLLLLAGHFPDHKCHIRALHFNHRMRGKASDDDEKWVGDLVAQLGVAGFFGQWNEKPEKSSSAADARVARFAFFREQLEHCNSRVLILGHHKDDVAETLLMRVARGSGTSGLAAPRPIQCFKDDRIHLRPLLNLSKRQIIDAMMTLNIPWREDASNDSDAYFRNRIRSFVVPVWQQSSPHDIIEGAAQSRRKLEEDDSALEVWLTELLPPEDFFGKTGDFSSLSDKPVALYRRALYQWLTANKLEDGLARETVMGLLQAMVDHRRLSVSVGTNAFIDVGNDRLALRVEAVTYDWPELRVACGQIVFFPDGGRLQIDAITLDESLRQFILSGQVDLSRMAYVDVSPQAFAGATVQLWQPGDRYRPLGAPGSSKLQDLFTNRKIPVMERNCLPVVRLGNNPVIWCPRLPPAEACKIGPDTNHALRLTYTPAQVDLDKG